MRPDAAEFYPTSHSSTSPASHCFSYSPAARTPAPAAAAQASPVAASPLCTASPAPSSSAARQLSLPSLSPSPAAASFGPASAASQENERAPRGGRRTRGGGATRGSGAHVIPPHHLFTYKLYSKPSSASRGGGGDRGDSSYSRGNWRANMGHTQQQLFAKERFVLANCRVLVSSEEDAKEALYNPDALVDWGHVVRVEMSSSAEDPVSCPFCLEQPESMLAPAVAKCGHIFCTPCVLRYFDVLARQQQASKAQHGGRSWQRCPLCFEPVARKDLRPALVHQVVPPRVGSRATFCLLSRPASSMAVSLALPFVRAAREACQAKLVLETAPDASSEAAEGTGAAPVPSREAAAVGASAPAPAASSCSAAGTIRGEEAEDDSADEKGDAFHAAFAHNFLPLQCPACATEGAARKNARRRKVHATALGQVVDSAEAGAPAGISQEGWKAMSRASNPSSRGMTRRLCGACLAAIPTAKSASDSAAAAPCPAPPSSSPAGEKTCGRAGDKGQPTPQSEKPTHALPCERTLGVHFARIALTHAPALPWECHLRQLGEARRRDNPRGEACGAPADAASLRALEMAEEFTLMKRDEATGGLCCACADPLQPPAPAAEFPDASPPAAADSEFRSLDSADKDRRENRADGEETNPPAGELEALDWYLRGTQDFERLVDGIQRLKDTRRLLRPQRRANEKEAAPGSGSAAGSAREAESEGTSSSAAPSPCLSSSPSPVSLRLEPCDREAGHQPDLPLLPESHAEALPPSSSSRVGVMCAEGARNKSEKGKGGGPLALSEFYFYQAADGQLCFVHPFFVKCLLHEAGGDEALLPPILREVPVRDVQTISIDEQLRRRFKCLAHLPQMAQASLVDVDLRSMLSPATARVFKEDFRRRAASRRERLLQEEREAAAAASASHAASHSSSFSARPFRFAPAEPLHPPADCSPQTFPSLPGRDASPTEPQGGGGDATAQGEEKEETEREGRRGREREREKGEARGDRGAFSFAAVVRRKEEEQRRLAEQRRQQEHFPSLGASVGPALLREEASRAPPPPAASRWAARATATARTPWGVASGVAARGAARGSRGGVKREGADGLADLNEDALPPRAGGCSLGEVLIFQATKRNAKGKQKAEKSKETVCKAP
ncbi:zinc finger, C3HC4 type (RING finger) domain-containing protein [Besnoitia besnoiti]|uniref:Zinc finger, C3HC4 type (RING finger) domain-containing protein n=1 Tax=Besnoitia besnoiti TaxID=94643 RepID=A0A2A9MH20_BESBE|nr:zinc finger, C3HC4 type (RING finger) domain-containing protein [Besnoitia besnoiti]PFH37199.1 zinc finger, C3HC4 type (RING finger) domain-containing protein [Besnoitia besnoiti]